MRVCSCVPLQLDRPAGGGVCEPDDRGEVRSARRLRPLPRQVGHHLQGERTAYGHGGGNVHLSSSDNNSVA